MNLSDAAHATVHDYPGGSESLAPRLGMSGAVLRNKVNPNNSFNHITLAEANKLMAITNDFRILHSMAAEHGFVSVKVDEEVAPSDMAVLEIITKIWLANGNVGRAVDDALADGRIERHEIDRIKEEVKLTERALHQLIKRLEDMAG